MKRIILFAAVAVVCVALAAPGYSADFSGKIGTTDPVTTVIGGAKYEPSTGVHVSVISSTTNYCVASVHDSALSKESGKEFAAISTDTTISWIPTTNVSTITACTAANAMPSGSWQK